MAGRGRPAAAAKKAKTKNESGSCGSRDEKRRTCKFRIFGNWPGVASLRESAGGHAFFVDREDGRAKSHRKDAKNAKDEERETGFTGLVSRPGGFATVTCRIESRPLAVILKILLILSTFPLPFCDLRASPQLRARG